MGVKKNNVLELDLVADRSLTEHARCRVTGPVKEEGKGQLGGWDNEKIDKGKLD